ncbi:low-density lipoprotein receptor-related protein 11 [Lampetra planeri]
MGVHLNVGLHLQARWRGVWEDDVGRDKRRCGMELGRERCSAGTGWGLVAVAECHGRGNVAPWRSVRVERARRPNDERAFVELTLDSKQHHHHHHHQRAHSQLHIAGPNTITTAAAASMTPSKRQHELLQQQQQPQQRLQQQRQPQQGAMMSRSLPTATLCALLLLLCLTTAAAGAAKMTASEKRETGGGGDWRHPIGPEDQQQQHHHHNHHYQQQRNRGPAELLPARHISSSNNNNNGIISSSSINNNGIISIISSSSGISSSSSRCDRDTDVSTMRRRIIRPQDSVAAGARFVSAPRGVRRWGGCLAACCSHAACSVAVLQGAPGDDDDDGGGGDDGDGGDDDGPELNCYLFDCPRGDDGRNVCSFSAHQGYTSFVLNENGRGGGDGGGGADGADDGDEKEEVDQEDGEQTRGRHVDDGTVDKDKPPQAQAGADVMLRVPESDATLSGLGSVDDHGITAYRWRLLSGDPSLQMASSEDGQLKLSGLREGVYVIRLTVTDTANQQGSDEVTITVLPSPAHTDVPSHDPPEPALPAKAPTVAQDVHNISEKMYQQPFQAQQPLSIHTNPGATQKQVDAVYVAPESSAVLPLALGLAVTVLLLVMLGGRFFVARKRLKKGRPLVSEESDYLINGMYL